MRPAVAANQSLNNIIITIMIALTGLVMAFTISTGDIGAGTFVALVPVLFGIAALIVSNPYYGIIFNLHYSFFFIGLNRYIPNIPLGVIVDGVLFLTTLSMVFRLNANNIKRLNNGVFGIVVLWFTYTFFEIFNPNSPKIQSWIYATRGVTIYAVQLVPLTLLIFDKKETLNSFIKVLMFWGVLSSLWGLKQMNFYLDSYEQAWLDQGGSVTHILFGQFRAFSFYSDAGQFGVTMAYIAIIALIMALGSSYKTKQRLIYLAIFIICLIGMSTSGSRGPTFVILFGGLIYISLIRNKRIILFGSLLSILIFGFLKFTYIGNSNYQLFRIRTSLDPQDASLMVRLENQEALRNYLSDKPFGAGMGTTDLWAQRFYPNSVLANLPTDSWFVKIWTETGIVGIIIFAYFLSYVIVIGGHRIRQVVNPDSKQKLMALYAGFIGVMTASFGNPVFGQAPLGTIMYMSIAMICAAYVYDDDTTFKA